MAEPEQKSHLAFWAYSAAFLGVFGHATSEFFSVYSGSEGPEVSVWRFTIGGAALLVVALVQKESRNLLRPVIKKKPVFGDPPRGFRDVHGTARFPLIPRFCFRGSGRHDCHHHADPSSGGGQNQQQVSRQCPKNGQRHRGLHWSHS